jgi:hypothetical protein
MLGRERPRAPSASRGCSRLTSLEFSQIVRAIDASTVRASMLLLCERWAETLYTRSVVGPAIFTGVPNRVHRGRAGRQQLASGVRAIEARHSSGLAVAGPPGFTRVAESPVSPNRLRRAARCASCAACAPDPSKGRMQWRPSVPGQPQESSLSVAVCLPPPHHRALPRPLVPGGRQLIHPFRSEDRAGRGGAPLRIPDPGARS